MITFNLIFEDSSSDNAFLKDDTDTIATLYKKSSLWHFKEEGFKIETKHRENINNILSIAIKHYCLKYGLKMPENYKIKEVLFV